MRTIAQQRLSTRQAEAVRGVLLALLTRGRREEFRDACRLARAVNNTEFRSRLQAAAATATGDADSRQRAQWMLDGCERTKA
jgi:hypothetical protein